MKRLGFLLLLMLLFVVAQAKKHVTYQNDSVTQVVIAQTDGSSQSVKDSVLLRKLSPEQLMQLEQQRIDIERERIEANSKEDMPLNGFGIFMIVLLPFLLVGSVVFIQARDRNRESIRKYDLYTKSLEMGKTVPDHFFDEPKKANAASNLKKGILWLVVGIALTISFLIIKEKDALILGIVPTFVGIGYLLVNKLDKSKTGSTVNNDEQHG